MKQIATLELTENANCDDIAHLLDDTVEKSPLLSTTSNEDGSYDIHVDKPGTTVNVVAVFGTTVTIDLGDITEEDAFSDDFPWEDFDAALVKYFDSLSENELRALYCEPEAITIDDPIFNEDGADADVSL